MSPPLKNMVSGTEQRGELETPIGGYRLAEVRRFFVRAGSDRGAAPRMSLCGGEKAARRNPGKEGRRGRKMGKGGGDCNTQATGSAAGQ